LSFQKNELDGAVVTLLWRYCGVIIVCVIVALLRRFIKKNLKKKKSSNPISKLLTFQNKKKLKTRRNCQKKLFRKCQTERDLTTPVTIIDLRTVSNGLKTGPYKTPLH
jgi:Trp operon repressor